MEICHWDEQIDQRNGKESLETGEGICGTLVCDRGSRQTREGEQVTRVRSPLNLCLIGDSRISSRDFPGGPVVKTRGSTAGGAGSISDWGTKIPDALRSGQKSKKQTNKQKPKKTLKNKNQL